LDVGPRRHCGHEAWIAESIHELRPAGRVNVQNSSTFRGIVLEPSTTPGQEATQAVDVEFPAAALKAKSLKEIRLELAYIP
jgi:hypothetical protein